MQVAALGLLKAIDRFDPARGIAFSSFAVPTMLGEVKRHFRDKSWTVRPPRDLQELTLRVEQATTLLSTQLSRSPSVAELSEHLGVGDEEILEALEAGRARSATSLSAPRGDAEDGSTLGDLLGDEEDGFARAEERATLAKLFARAVAARAHRADPPLPPGHDAGRDRSRSSAFRRCRSRASSGARSSASGSLRSVVPENIPRWT